MTKILIEFGTEFSKVSHLVFALILVTSLEWKSCERQGYKAGYWLILFDKSISRAMNQRKANGHVG